MLTEFIRDHAFTAAWFGLMTGVWLGWAQEDPPQRWRPWLGAGSVIGLAIAGAFGYSVVRNWATASALEGKYQWFGVLVAAEVVAAGIGCLLLARRGQGRWMAWWVAIVVALHFIPLAFMLEDASHAVLGLVQLVLLALIYPRLRRESRTTSAWTGAVMGGALLLFAVISAVMFFVRHGTPW
ncbi:hypothetical protein EG850_08960 [Gulosibacter macacae]|uniref:Uncharacterized protein n=1 Tax=Gulosibacter macacae TaxID=2488791 RepID=A0A3P3W0Q1_9MICO|nr:hypothetical protein [Gulosibacter macacae]RRJ86463.1 hypothetical protein EG850_08960 [Gulosibacter macacae]